VPGQSGVTLIEMLIVVTLIALMVGISFPAVATGIDSIRLQSTSDSIASFLLGALNRSERRQELLELSISPAANAIAVAGANYQKRYDLPAGLKIAAVLPPTPLETGAVRRFLLYPGGAPPRIGIRIVNQRGAQRIVAIDPITGIPQVERVAEK
jgi:prepilin-type N-terminal cleavage/methylation domain-containing protein